MPLKTIREFIKLESSAGIFLFAATILALIWANSPFSQDYFDILHVHMGFNIAGHGLDKPLIFWINEGLMAFFFLLVGLEMKREFLCGELNTWRKIATPAIAALAGMSIPALIYIAFTYHDPSLLRGWATPTATDIAFSLGILALLGSRIPTSLKVFLTSLATFDDLGAIIIIATFYTAKISITYIIVSLSILALLIALNRFKMRKRMFYLILGPLLWYFVYKSGIHPSIIGVIMAMLIPYEHYNRDYTQSSVKILEERLHPWVIYLILPIFALANAGVSMETIRWEDLVSPLAAGIFCALFFGNQIGIFIITWTASKMRLAILPEGATLRQFYGVCIICGVGFTMSFFVGSLAFNDLDNSFRLLNQVKLGVMGGSFASGLFGYCWLRWASNKNGG